MFRKFLSHPLKDFPGGLDESVSPERYKTLRTKLVALMALVAALPLLIMAVINYHQTQTALIREVQNPLRAMLGKTRTSLELFLAERTSAVSFIAKAYSFQELSDEKALSRIFRVMKQEFDGFVDLGLIDASGHQVTYAGPYSLKGKNYSEQPWFDQVRIKGKYISDVFMGFRMFPHVIIAVQHITDSGDSWILRATLDTRQFDKLIAAMSLEPESDAFILNREGLLQTPSNYYGKVLEKIPLDMPPASYESTVRPVKDPAGRELLMGYTFSSDSDFVVMTLKPQATISQAWYMVRTDLAAIFLVGLVLIFLVAFKITDLLLKRMRDSESQRELAFKQVEHTQKLSSIGRLAAGLAHEVNNPLAIINEKTGLLRDLISLKPEFPDKERFLGLTDAVAKAVDRCRGITHRMLGFAKRMEVKVEVLDVNEIITETLEFLNKEAAYRNVELRLNLGDNLPHIASDRGQLQQVFLNIVNNALAAVADGGFISLTTWEKDLDTVGVSIQDNGCGMSEETLNHIFEPFFTTKKGQGTGLGLSITYGIVKRLGGDIAVASKIKQGTTFTIFLPKKPPEGAL
jgi:two-component system NtrC family sensor kinase